MNRLRLHLAPAWGPGYGYPNLPAAMARTMGHTSSGWFILGLDAG